MKKRILTASMLAAILAVSACGNGAKPVPTTGPAPEVTSAASDGTSAGNTSAAETPAEDTSSAETAAAQEEKTDDTGFEVTKTVIYTGINDKKYYLEDAVEVNEEWGMATYDTALVRVSTGTYHDSETEPDLFTPDEFIYSGEKAELGTVYQVKKDDVMGDLKIASAETQISFIKNDETGEYISMPFYSCTKIDGDITVTGVLRYYFDEQYAISSGDLVFVPDASYKGLPLSFSPSGMYEDYGVTSFDMKETIPEDGGYGDTYYAGGICVYSDAPRLRLGNILQDDALKSNSDLTTLLDGAKADCSKRVEVTLTNLQLEWSDQFGSDHSSAVIKSIKGV